MKRKIISTVLLIIAFALLFGRMLCGFVCPLGFLQDVAHQARVALRIEGIALNERVYAILRFIKWVMLVLFLGISLIGGSFCDFCPAAALTVPAALMLGTVFALASSLVPALLILALAGALSTKITAQLGRALPRFQLAVYGFYLISAVYGLMK